jgi:hypothetical protein
MVKFFLLFLFFPFLSMENTLAAKIAQVIIPKAIVYADEDLTAPIGHVSNGKLIPVGKPLLHKTEIVPVIISGRLAYIHIQDIRYVSEEDEELEKRKGAPREHKIDQEFMTTEDKLTENNFVTFSYGAIGTGTEVQTFFEKADGREQSSFHRFVVDLYHRTPEKRVNWGISFEYFRAAGSTASIDSFLFSPQVSFSLIKIQKVNFEFFSALNMGAGNTIRIDNNFANEPRGWMYGFELGARASLPLSSKWSATGSLSHRSLKAVDITNLEYPDGSFGEINSIQGTGFTLGFTYSL